jgi:hypothetical protein
MINYFKAFFQKNKNARSILKKVITPLNAKPASTSWVLSHFKVEAGVLVLEYSF